MSWDSYGDTVRGHAQAGPELRVEIYTKDGSVCTTERSLYEHLDKFASAFAGMNEGVAEFQRNGLTRNGERFQFLRFDGDEILFKNKENSVYVHDSKTTIICGIFPESLQGGNVSKGLRVVAEYLESLNM